MALRAALMEEKIPANYSTWIPKVNLKKETTIIIYVAGVPKDRRQILGT